MFAGIDKPIEFTVLQQIHIPSENSEAEYDSAIIVLAKGKRQNNCMVCKFLGDLQAH